MRLSKRLAKHFLRSVEHDKAFWFDRHFHVYSLKEFLDALPKISSESFNFHLNRDKNDFEPWIRHVIGDEALANIIKKVRARKTLIRKVKERVEKLEEYLR